MYEFDWDKMLAIYFQEIVDALQNLGYSSSEAQSIFNSYRELIIREDADWSAEEWAEELQYAVQEGFTPEQWHAKCDEIDEAIAAMEQAKKLKALQQKQKVRIPLKKPLLRPFRPFS